LRGPDKDLLGFLNRSNHLAVKIHLALWERSYMEATTGSGLYATNTTPGPCDYVTMTVARLCDDIGLKRRKGGHKRESRETVIGLLKLLTSMELFCIYQPHKNVPPERIRSHLWKRGNTPEGLGSYSDLFAGDWGVKISKGPHAFSYAPGRYFENPTWRRSNKSVAFVHSGLLKINSGKSYRWAVIVGAYLSILARMNGYRPITMSLETLVDRTGLGVMCGKKPSERIEENMLGALEYLVEIGVIEKWALTEPMNVKGDARTHDQSTNSKFKEGVKQWLTRSAIIHWPDFIEKRAHRLYKIKKKYV
jgi:hypothetical protein